MKRPRAVDVKWSLSQLRRAGVLQPHVVYEITSSMRQPTELVKALALRDRVMLDLATGTLEDLTLALHSISKLNMTKEILYVSGSGHILQDMSI